MQMRSRCRCAEVEVLRRLRRRAGAEVLLCRGGEVLRVQRCRGAEVQVQVQVQV